MLGKCQVEILRSGLSLRVPTIDFANRALHAGYSSRRHSGGCQRIHGRPHLLLRVHRFVCLRQLQTSNLPAGKVWYKPATTTAKCLFGMTLGCLAFFLQMTTTDFLAAVSNVKGRELLSNTRNWTGPASC